MSNIEQDIPDKKIKIDGYIPLNVCSCQGENLTNNKTTNFLVYCFI
ncbi:MAG: hypothetical protein ACFFE4_18455 [Candidatus Thorarchaeota archaeon]